MNNYTKALTLLGAVALISSCSQIKQEGNQVTVKVKEGDAKLVRLEVMGPKIIRVSATAEEQFADKPSLIIVPQQPLAEAIQTTEHGDTVTVQTSALKAHVLKSTGRVWFTDLQGDELLSEQEQGSKRFTPYECTQTVWKHSEGNTTTDDNSVGYNDQAVPTQYKGWTTQVVFNSQGEEAFYGLGQHQADEWNYKGRNEELFQYNTKVSIPFVVSNRNYGVLYDSYSMMRFGNPRDYSQLPTLFKLYDKEGKEGALTGTYSAPGQETLVRREERIYFENLKSARDLPQFPLAQATVVYEGEIEPRSSGEYHFSHYYSGYQKIYIDGRNVYHEDVAGTGRPDDQTIWRTAWNPNARKFKLELEAGRRYKIRLEWQPDGGEAYCGLRALAPTSHYEQRQLSLWSEMSQQMDYYVMFGDNIDEVIKGYRQLTGKAQIMPQWLLGYWQSRERYKTQDEILDALKGFRKRHIPIDNIVMDWNYWTPDQWGAFEFDPTRFSDPKGMIDEIHAQNAKIMISCWPKYYLGTEHFKELNEMGAIYQQSIKDTLIDWLGFKYAFYDAYNPEARKVFWNQLWEHLGTIGMDAWWMDASEPNIRDCTDIPYRKLLCGPTYLGSSDEYFNAYSIVNAEAIYDGQRQKNDNRVFLLTRNGFAGQQRYSTATWSGDIGTRWEDMKTQVTAGLNFCISGVPYWSQDIGGFSVEKRYERAQREFERTGRESEDLKDWRELNVRWHEWGVFAPIYRSHGQFPFREPWNIAPEGHPAYKAICQQIELRYRLMPYIYSLAAMVHFDDYTMMRPLVMDFGHDPGVRDIGYQFMFGPAIMVNPVLEYKARQRDVYFPRVVSGKTRGLKPCWYDFYSGIMVSKGTDVRLCDAPYDRIPLYVPSGSILPVGPAIEYTGQKPADCLRVFVYQGSNGDFTLYEDECTNYNYEKGAFSKIRFTYDEKSHTLSIAQREGSFPGMLAEREFIIVPVNPQQPQGFDPDAKGISVRYNGEAQQIELPETKHAEVSSKAPARKS
ncbi:MAG: DUF5110 domain-containing protein, partial [Bacteroidales bacterium]|nr:DUF5110 domain-containing protein [Bacteroidales bacterium]